ncbi:MAG: DUF3795 domain-containing protein [Clostridia bacterium]|nr:DUF3795 domain-containing protein [Clostridia bacterium]
MNNENKMNSNTIPSAEHPAYCGFDCGRCPIYRATVDNDAQLKEELIKKYSTPERQLTEADISCLGCKAEKRYLHAYCEECAIRRCAVEHGCGYNCGECASYPCEMIEKRIPAEGESRANMDAVNRTKFAKND